jgi:MFS family permease
MAVGLAAGSGGAFGLALLTNFYSGLLFIALIGASLAVVTPILFALLQEDTPADMRGRVFTTFGSGAMAASMIGILGFGWSADTMGARWSLIAMGVILAAAAALALILRLCLPKIKSC